MRPSPPSRVPRALAPPLLLLGLLVLFIDTAGAQPADDPLISFSKSCDLIQDQPGDGFSAVCTKRDGSRVQSFIFWKKKCKTKVVAVDGQLVCGRPSSNTPDLFPPGPWFRFCRDFFREGDAMYATCQDETGKWVAASIPKKCDAREALFVGKKGGLKCLAVEKPPGTYLRSCGVVGLTVKWDAPVLALGELTNAKYLPFGEDYVYTISGNCQMRDDRWRAYVSWPASRCVGDIRNDNGQIRCNMEPGPRGSYRWGCGSIKVEGDRLRASCLNDAGIPGPTHIKLPCRGVLIDRGGQLVCDALPPPEF